MYNMYIMNVGDTHTRSKGCSGELNLLFCTLSQSRKTSSPPLTLPLVRSRRQIFRVPADGASVREGGRRGGGREGGRMGGRQGKST